MAFLHTSHVLSEMITESLMCLIVFRRQRPRLLPKNLTRNTCPSQDLVNFVRHLQN
uniref:Uncharacterized protein n=1 Tax=Felis catus TaxID=9685 RepID=A0ABI7YPV7_FELCA